MTTEQEQILQSVNRTLSEGGDVNRLSKDVSDSIASGREPEAADKMLTEVTQELVKNGNMPSLVRAFAGSNFKDLDLDGNGSIGERELQKIDESRFFNRSISAFDHQMIKYMRSNFGQIAEASDEWGFDTSITPEDLLAHESKVGVQLKKSAMAQSIGEVFGREDTFSRTDKDRDGLLSDKEMKSAIASSSTPETERAALQLMRDNRSEIAKVSDDERLWESEISRADIAGFVERNKLESVLKPVAAANFYSLPGVAKLDGNRFLPGMLVEFGKENLSAIDLGNDGYVSRHDLERIGGSKRWSAGLGAEERRALTEMNRSMELIQRSNRDEKYWYKDTKGITSNDLNAYARDQWANLADIPTKPGDHNMSLTIGGVKRDYTVHIPPGYDGSKPVPVMYFYHYFTGSGKEMAEYSGMNAISDRENFITVYPNAEGYLGNMWRQWNLNNNPSYRVDEVAFAGSLMDTVESKLNVDKSRQYIAGYSNGGMLAHELAAKFSDRVAAMASISGCQNAVLPAPAEGVPALLIHGDKDKLVPIQGRLLTPLFPRMMSLERGREYWCDANGTDKYSSERITPSAMCETYTNSKNGKEVRVITMENVGHGYPGSNHSIDGNPSSGINASEEIWKFFQRHSR